MKSFLLFILFISVGISTNAQNQKKVYITHEKKTYISQEKPIFIINNQIIGSAQSLNKVSNENILKIEILKDDKLDSINLYPLKKNNRGIIKIEINIEIDIKTQKELNRFFGLKEASDIYVNGYLIKDKNKSISTKSINKIEKLKADGVFLKMPSLNIIFE